MMAMTTISSMSENPRALRQTGWRAWKDSSGRGNERKGAVPFSPGRRGEGRARRVGVMGRDIDLSGRGQERGGGGEALPRSARFLARSETPPSGGAETDCDCDESQPIRFAAENAANASARVGGAFRQRRGREKGATCRRLPWQAWPSRSRRETADSSE